MAKRGERKHMKRLSAPQRIPLRDKKKRGRRFLINTSPGPHPKEDSEPLAFLLREHLGIARNIKEVRYILQEGKVKIDGKIRKKEDFPIGLMDIVEVGENKYRVWIDNKGRLITEKIDDSERKLKKVKNKVEISKDTYQLTFHDGTTILIRDNNIKVGDSVVFNLKEKKIEKHIPLKEGTLCLVVEGKHSGEKAKLKEIKIRKGTKEAVLDFNGKDVITRWNYLFALE